MPDSNASDIDQKFDTMSELISKRVQTHVDGQLRPTSAMLQNVQTYFEEKREKKRRKKEAQQFNEEVEKRVNALVKQREGSQQSSRPNGNGNSQVESIFQ